MRRRRGAAGRPGAASGQRPKRRVTRRCPPGGPSAGRLFSFSTGDAFRPCFLGGRRVWGRPGPGRATTAPPSQRRRSGPARRRAGWLAFPGDCGWERRRGWPHGGRDGEQAYGQPRGAPLREGAAGGERAFAHAAGCGRWLAGNPCPPGPGGRTNAPSPARRRSAAPFVPPGAGLGGRFGPGGPKRRGRARPIALPVAGGFSFPRRRSFLPPLAWSQRHGADLWPGRATSAPSPARRRSDAPLAPPGGGLEPLRRAAEAARQRAPSPTLRRSGVLPLVAKAFETTTLATYRSGTCATAQALVVLSRAISSEGCKSVLPNCWRAPRSMETLPSCRSCPSWSMMAIEGILCARRGRRRTVCRVGTLR